MKKPAMPALAIVTFLLASLMTAATRGATKAELFAVVQVGEDIKVVRKSELPSLSKSVAEEDKRRQKAYQDSKKAKPTAKSRGGGKGKGADQGMVPGMGMGMAGEQGDMPKPVKRSVRVLKNSLKTEQDARDWEEKFLEEREGSKPGKKAGGW